MKILTISIAAYNVEAYLEQTLESFIDETILEDLEVIVVDDGSKDATAAIAQRYVERYPGTFRLIAKPNGGHGSTINAGLQAATGKYFKIVDGDDWVDTPELKKLVEALKCTDADLVMTNYVVCNVTDNRTDKVEVASKECYNRIFWFGKDRLDKYIKTYEMHAITVKTDVLRNNHVRITENCFYVDMEFDVFTALYSQSVLFLDACVYMYRVGNVNQSISALSAQKHVDMHRKVTMNLVSFFSSHVEKTQQQDAVKYEMIFRQVVYMVTCHYSILLSFKYSKDILERFRDFDAELGRKSGVIYRACAHRQKTVSWMRLAPAWSMPVLSFVYRKIKHLD